MTEQDTTQRPRAVRTAAAAAVVEAEMTSAPDHVLILTDDEGRYYAVPEALIRQGRIPAAQQPALEHALGGAADDDVAGFRFRTHCGHALRSAEPAPLGPRYRPLAVARLEIGGRL